MRIAIIAPLVTPIREPQQGGSQAVVADLARGLKDRGHEVEVYAATDSAIPGVTVIDTGIDAQSLAALLYRADRPRLDTAEAGEVAFRTVLNAVGMRAYDVVHNHAFDPPAVRYAVELPCPVVHTLHLPPEEPMTAALSHALKSRNPPTIAAVSESSAAAWRKLIQVDVVLRDGVPVDRIPWSAASGEGLVFAGRFSPEKGAIDAVQIARRAGASIDLFGDAYDVDYAGRLADSYGGQAGIAIHNGVPREDLWQRMTRACAVLCPVKWDEPFGMVAAEAQAAGTPVIAYRRGALPEVVVDRKTGFLVPPDDIASAADAVGRAAALSRRNCRKHAETHLSLDAMVSAHERLYGRVLASRSRAHA